MTRKRLRECHTPESALDQLRKESKALSNRMQANTRKQKSTARARDSTTVSPCMKRVLVLLYVFASFDPSWAQSYWAYRRKQEKRPAMLSSDTKRCIEDMFLAYSDDGLANLIDPETTPSKVAWRRAAGWQNKMKLQRWVRMQNVRRGLAVRSALVIRQYNNIRRGTPYLLKRDDYGDPAFQVASRVLLHRWRKIVNGRWKSIRIKENISLLSRREKVPLLSSFPFKTFPLFSEFFSRKK